VHFITVDYLLNSLSVVKRKKNFI